MGETQSGNSMSLIRQSYQQCATVQGVEEPLEGIYVLAFSSSEIGAIAKPGQFVNVRACDSVVPLLRRPFSISAVDDSKIEIVFNVVGAGTKMLSQKKRGETIDVIGPLGNSFTIDESFDLALLVAGGMGIAPFPFLISELRRRGKPFRVYAGVRSKSLIYTRGIENVSIATDDGSQGTRGTVVDLLSADLGKEGRNRIKIFGCGPSKMLSALAAYARSVGVRCEVSLETEMACGVGVCQGCPVEKRTGSKKYALSCTEGPNFDVNDIVI